MGVSFDTKDIFFFRTRKDADDFFDQTPVRTERYGAHFNVDCPLWKQEVDLKIYGFEGVNAYAVEVTTGGYGVPSLVEFNRNHVVGVIREVYSCQAQDINYMMWITKDEFTYERSDPYDQDDGEYEYPVWPPFDEDHFITSQSYGNACDQYDADFRRYKAQLLEDLVEDAIAETEAIVQKHED